MIRLSQFRSEELAAELTRRGYAVRHTAEASRQLSFHRRAPTPPGVDFKAEAVERLRQQVTAEMVRFETSVRPGMTPGENETIHSAYLLLL